MAVQECFQLLPASGEEQPRQYDQGRAVRLGQLPAGDDQAAANEARRKAKGKQPAAVEQQPGAAAGSDALMDGMLRLLFGRGVPERHPAAADGASGSGAGSSRAAEQQAAQAGRGVEQQAAQAALAELLFPVPKPRP